MCVYLFANVATTSTRKPISANFRAFVTDFFVCGKYTVEGDKAVVKLRQELKIQTVKFKDLWIIISQCTFLRQLFSDTSTPQGNPSKFSVAKTKTDFCTVGGTRG